MQPLRTVWVAIVLGVLLWGRPLVFGAEIHVAPAGNDAAAGAADAPFHSLARAQREVRRLTAAGLREAVTVVLHAGRDRQAQGESVGLRLSAGGGQQERTIRRDPNLAGMLAMPCHH